MADQTLDALRAALGAQYDVLRPLGQGGMGSVFLARDRTLDREVAIKVINSEVASNATLRERFLLEARTVAKLRHPGIVSVFAAGEANGILYFVMEYVPGESLRDALTREQRLSPAEGTRIIREIALALDHAHASGLIHRDVKPENILLDSATGRAMLTDFGVARALESDGNITGTGMILGSPRYMSPEQASGDGALDGRSDLYALALVAYECFSGAPAVQAQTAAAMMMKHLTETPTPLGTLATDLTPGLIAAIERGLVKDPEGRWQSGAAFADALGGGSTTGAGFSGTNASASNPAASRSRMPRIVLGAAAVSIAAGILAVTLRGGDADAGSSAAADARGSRYVVAPFEIQSGDPSVTWLREGSVNMLTLTLGQWSDLQVVDYERTLSLLDAEQLGDKPRLSLDDARALGRRAGAGVVLTGQVQTTADSLLVTAKLYEVASGNVVEQAQDGGAIGADPRPVFDRLAKRLLNVAGGPTSTVELERATTSNLRAYRAYLDGVRYLQSWRMTEADSAFRVATTADSTFALAYHKRALALGWSEATGPDYVGSATRAFELADRLPTRERALVEGHYFLVKGLSTGFGVVDPQSLADYERAMAVYADLVARDSLVAEAWYGWADANFHGRSGDNLVQLVDRTNKAVAGFHRTLQVDSSFHLAYSHLVELYGNAAGPNTGLLLQADTTIILSSDPVIAKLGGTEGVARIRVAAGRRGAEIARAWMRADATAAQPVVQLARLFEMMGQPDSAVRVLRDAATRPGVPQTAVAIGAARFVLATADTGAYTFVKDFVARFPADSLRRVPFNVRLEGLGGVLTSAAMSGNGALLQQTSALLAQDGVLIPEVRGIVGTTSALLTVAMGTPADAAFHAQMRGMISGVEALPPGMAVQAKQGSASLLYGAYLATRERRYRDAMEDWLGGDALGFTELDALSALDRGDSTVARQLARDFTPPAELATARFSYGGMRTMARAEVLARLGLLRQAAETYEALDTRRFIPQAFGEPGYVLWVRSLLDRARLWAELGERDKAAVAYERFLAHWQSADGVAARQVQEARRELAQLRDAPAR